LGTSAPTARWSATLGGHGRFLFLESSLAADNPIELNFALGIDGETWIFSEGDEVSVWSVELGSSDELSLTFDAGDPRNTGVPGVDAFTLVRGEASAFEPGTFAFSAIAFPGEGEVATNTCIARALPGPFQIIRGELALTAQYIGGATLAFENYSDMACITESQPDESQVYATFFELDRDSFNAWLEEQAGAASLAVSGTVTIEGETITLERTRCTPDPVCADFASLVALVRDL
jgi:hypothetical protein